MLKGKIRKTHSDKFKGKVVLAAIKGDKTINELCQEFAVTASQIYTWRDRLLKNVSTIFEDKRCKDKHKDEIAKLHKIIGKQAVEIDFLADVFNRLK